uniref:ISXO2-like transposase domain-containing protein n=1 Tax=Octopus bimaculoides TaxID=37653 RepID=A0A0L8H4Q7_OCTBM
MESMMCKFNGGWDREDKNRFLVFVPDRSSETLLPLIKKFIKPGTTIYSDYWSASY